MALLPVIVQHLRTAQARGLEWPTEGRAQLFFLQLQITDCP